MAEISESPDGSARGVLHNSSAAVGADGDYLSAGQSGVKRARFGDNLRISANANRGDAVDCIAKAIRPAAAETPKFVRRRLMQKDARPTPPARPKWSRLIAPTTLLRRLADDPQNAVRAGDDKKFRIASDSGGDFAPHSRLRQNFAVVKAKANQRAVGGGGAQRIRANVRR